MKAEAGLEVEIFFLTIIIHPQNDCFGILVGEKCTKICVIEKGGCRERHL